MFTYKFLFTYQIFTTQREVHGIIQIWGTTSVLLNKNLYFNKNSQRFTNTLISRSIALTQQLSRRDPESTAIVVPVNVLEVQILKPHVSPTESKRIGMWLSTLFIVTHSSGYSYAHRNVRTYLQNFQREGLSYLF